MKVGGVGGVGSFGAVEAFGRLGEKDETSVMWRKRGTFGPLKERRLWLKEARLMRSTCRKEVERWILVASFEIFTTIQALRLTHVIPSLHR